MKFDVFTAIWFLSLIASSLYTAISVFRRSSARETDWSLYSRLMIVAVLLARETDSVDMQPSTTDSRASFWTLMRRPWQSSV